MHLPLACPEVPTRAAAQVTPLCVGAAVSAGAAAGRALVHILASPEGLVKVKAGWAKAFEAPQGVVAGGGAAGRGTRALVLICGENMEGGLHGDTCIKCSGLQYCTDCGRKKHFFSTNKGSKAIGQPSVQKVFFHANASLGSAPDPGVKFLVFVPAFHCPRLRQP